MPPPNLRVLLNHIDANMQAFHESSNFFPATLTRWLLTQRRQQLEVQSFDQRFEILP
jgi:hypothetical protein